MTLYAFSSENWNRPDTEVNDLMGLLGYYLDKEVGLLEKEGIRLRVIGDLSLCDPKLAKLIEKAIERTKNNQQLNLTIALSYGARQELAMATRAIAEEVTAQKLKLQDITEQHITERLYTADLPDPDLLIRTGGEKRLSNFLLWQSAYTELYFTDIFWPDFTHQDLRQAIDEFQLRERRYGGV
jgi:undecaprenyl diphosphate synthase